jgi:hypothetical protein
VLGRDVFFQRVKKYNERHASDDDSPGGSFFWELRRYPPFSYCDFVRRLASGASISDINGSCTIIHFCYNITLGKVLRGNMFMIFLLLFNHQP